VVSIQSLPGNQAIALRSASGKRAETKVRLDFLQAESRANPESPGWH
jgi:hypothetical protein